MPPSGGPRSIPSPDQPVTLPKTYPNCFPCAKSVISDKPGVKLAEAAIPWRTRDATSIQTDSAAANARVLALKAKLPATITLTRPYFSEIVANSPLVSKIAAAYALKIIPIAVGVAYSSLAYEGKIKIANPYTI